MSAFFYYIREHKTHKIMNWKPKGDTIGTHRGYIKAEDFNENDLAELIAKAKRRNINENVFLLGCGLVPVQPQLEILTSNEVEKKKAPARRKKEDKTEEVKAE